MREARENGQAEVAVAKNAAHWGPQHTDAPAQQLVSCPRPVPSVVMFCTELHSLCPGILRFLVCVAQNRTRSWLVPGLPPVFLPTMSSTLPDTAHWTEFDDVPGTCGFRACASHTVCGSRAVDVTL